MQRTHPNRDVIAQLKDVEGTDRRGRRQHLHKAGEVGSELTGCGRALEANQPRANAIIPPAIKVGKQKLPKALAVAVLHRSWRMDSIHLPAWNPCLQEWSDTGHSHWPTMLAATQSCIGHAMGISAMLGTMA